MAFEKGIALTVKVTVAATPTLIGGQKNATINRGATVADTTSKDGAGVKTGAAVSTNWSVECDGFVVASDTAYAQLLTSWAAMTDVTVTLTYPDTTTESGTAIVTNVSDAGEVEGMHTYNVTLEGNGALS